MEYKNYRNLLDSEIRNTFGLGFSDLNIQETDVKEYMKFDWTVQDVVEHLEIKHDLINIKDSDSWI